jgi:hypothetical protein
VQFSGTERCFFTRNISWWGGIEEDVCEIINIVGFLGIYPEVNCLA